MLIVSFMGSSFLVVVFLVMSAPIGLTYHHMVVGF